MTTTCATCGKEEVAEGTFHKDLASFRLKQYHYCPLCWAKRQRRQWKFVAVLVAITVAVWTLDFTLADDAQLTVISNRFRIVLLFPFCYLAIVPHELGHALVARMLGWRVFYIALGTGRTVWMFRLAGFRIEIKAMPAGGFVMTAGSRLVYYRTKDFLMVLAGPGANLAIFAAAYCWTGQTLVVNPFADGVSPLGLWATANLFVAALSLVPYKTPIDFGALRASTYSDGLHMLIIPFFRDTTIKQFHAAYYYLEGMECFESGCYEAAKEWFLKGLALYPENLSNRFGLAFVQVFLKDSHAARDQWLTALDHKDLPVDFRPILLNNIAWADLVIGSPELLEEADRLSQQALDARPTYAPFLGTRGSILIERGEPENGLPMIRLAFENNADARLKALNACYIALGEFKLGNREEARKAVELARSLDADCVLLDKVAKEMDAGGENSALRV